MTISMDWAWKLENYRQKAGLLFVQVKDDSVIIDKLHKSIDKLTEANAIAHKVVDAQDSTIAAQHGIIKQKDIIIDNKNCPIKWWWLPLAAGAGWLIGKAD